MARPQELSLLQETYGICRLPAAAPIPEWASAEPLCSATRTGTELTIICPQDVIPPDHRDEMSWRCLRIDGSFDLNQVGVLASLAEPLARAGISIFVFGSYETDFVLVKQADIKEAIAALSASGHAVAT